MNTELDRTPADPDSAAYAAGRRAGIALSAVAIAAVSFIGLLSLEKAILAFVLGMIALRGASPGSAARRRSILAIVIACIYAAGWITFIVVYRDKLAELVRLLQKLG
ncbi:MAG: hypothetical protein ACE15C_05425 [Phycisphaerae bacterium]